MIQRYKFTNPGPQIEEDPDGSIVFYSSIVKATEPVDIYTHTPSGKMNKNKGGAGNGTGSYTGGTWVLLDDHRAHMAALDIKYAREEEEAVPGIKHPRPLETGTDIPDPIAESWRYQFNATMGPYLHLDDHGEWIPYRVHVAIVKTMAEKKNANHIRDLHRWRRKDERAHRDFNRERLNRDIRFSEEFLQRADIELILTELAHHLSEGDSTVAGPGKAPDTRPDSDEMIQAAQRLARSSGKVYTAFEMEDPEDDEYEDD